ncbi:hypothetical protein QFC24_005930 [Naganishia onofrii]|uniref:Uncharacterized protein n=1 Tax=Naganishia onofrii TaxID=1851511 RepID=A0ACC2X6H6_9TREE|nr:hypothetical protein QFC24_005930 [Naganishia onofrii]
MITAIPTTLTSAVTTTSTTTYTSTIIPPQPTRIVPQFKAPPPSYKQSSLKLWESRPTRQDLVLAPTDQQELGNWKEISALPASHRRIVLPKRFLPEAVFGVPEDSTAISSSDASGPLARVDDQIPNLAIVPLNLFPLSEKPLVVDVSFNVGLDTSHAVWQRAISAAFLHSDVQDRLESIRKSYIGPFLEDTDPKGNKFKAMAIFEMLTGFSADVTEQPCPQNGNVIDKVSTPLFEKLDGKDENMDWSWLYNDFVEMVQNRTLVYPPTVMFSSDQKLRSVTIPNSFDLFILNLADPARPEADKDAQGNPIEYPLKQVQAMLVWSVRQKDLSIPLNSTSTRELIRKKVPTQSEYYQNGPWEPLPAANA